MLKEVINDIVKDLSWCQVQDRTNLYLSQVFEKLSAEADMKEKALDLYSNYLSNRNPLKVLKAITKNQKRKDVEILLNYKDKGENSKECVNTESELEGDLINE